MRRREFLGVLGGAAATWPLTARAQQPAMPVIGYLHSTSAETNVNFLTAFRKGLSEGGFVEGQNVAIEFRWAAGKIDRLPALASDLVRRRVAVIATPADTPATLAAKAATKAIPIVFAIGADPIELGLVKSFNRPGGNVTGIGFQNIELTTKRLAMLRELAPQAVRFGVLVDPAFAFNASLVKDVQASAAVLKLPVEVLQASTVAEIDAAFATLAQKPGSALLVGPNAFFTARRAQLATLAARHAIPAMYPLREFADSGGLICYGPSFLDVYRQTGSYTGRVLKGEKPADLPVQAPTKYELVVNLKTAKALGLTVPLILQQRADEVIE